MYKILGGDGKEYGPISADTVRVWISEGRANAQTQVLPEGGAIWVALGQLAEFAGLFHAPSPAAGFASPAPGVRMNPLALTGFISSIVAFPGCICCLTIYGVPFSIGGIICSVIGLAQIRKEPDRFTGRGLAIAGIIIGVAHLLLLAGLLIFGVAFNWADIQKELGKH